MANHKAGVVHVAFEGIVALFKTKTYAGFCGVEGEIYHIGVAEPEKRAVVVAETGIFVEVGELELVFVQLLVINLSFHHEIKVCIIE